MDSRRSIHSRKGSQSQRSGFVGIPHLLPLRLGAFAAGALVVATVVACSPVKFSQDESLKCTGQICSDVTGPGEQNYEITVGSGKVDIVFVNDNSASMSFEQSRMAQRFSSFISALDAKGVDYRIGMITTDVSTGAPFGNSARPVNLNGALQDGRLVRFGNGASFLTKATANKEGLFAQAISRPETLGCEAYLSANSGNVGQVSPAYLDNCASPDERGFAALRLFLNGEASGFVRSDSSDLAFVFLSDEDVRSSLYYQTPSYALALEDLPSTLLAAVQARYPGKDVRFHGMIVRPGSLIGRTPTQAAQQLEQAVTLALPGSGSSTGWNPESNFAAGDVACLNQQSTQTNGVLGSYAYLYALAIRLTNGVEGNICDSDYGARLAAIGDNIGESLRDHTLRCANPSGLVVQFLVGQPVGYTVNGTNLTFASDLVGGTRVRLTYKCQ